MRGFESLSMSLGTSDIIVHTFLRHVTVLPMPAAQTAARPQ